MPQIRGHVPFVDSHSSRLRSALYVYLITSLFLYIYQYLFSLSRVGINKYISLFESQGQKEIVAVSGVREVSRVCVCVCVCGVNVCVYVILMCVCVLPVEGTLVKGFFLNLLFFLLFF